MTPIVPTGRAVWLLALAAPLALLVAAVVPGAWVVAPVLCLTLAVLVVADGFGAGRVDAVALTVPTDIEVGAEAQVLVSAHFAGRARSVEAAFAADTRLVPGGRAVGALVSGEDGWDASIPITPARRGTGGIERLWLRWTGPLGLGARQVERREHASVRVLPNIAALRSRTFQAYLRDAQTGLVARKLRGQGTEFDALSEYRPGIDRRHIDWKTSARHGKLYAREFETERNSQVVLAFDCGRSMCEPVDGVPRIDRAVSAGLATAFVALRGGDKVSLFGFAARPAVATPFVNGIGAFHRLQQAAAGLDYSAQEPNFTLALATLAGRLQRRSLVIVFSDFTDPTSAQLMVESVGRLVRRHLVLFVTLADEELESIADDVPADIDKLGMAVAADSLLRQRALAIRQLRQLGVDVIEAPHALIGTRLVDAYLDIKRAGTIG